MICFVAEIARGEHFRISLAISLALFNISFAGIISLIKPMFLASVLFINFPVNKRLSASFCGIIFASLAAPPAPANNPTLGSGKPKVDLSEAINISQESAISNPPPRANPFIAAIIGILNSLENLSINKSEVSEVIFLPIDILADNSNIIWTSKTFKDGLYKFWKINYLEHKIWGATAAILVCLASRIWYKSNMTLLIEGE